LAIASALGVGGAAALAAWTAVPVAVAVVLFVLGGGFMPPLGPAMRSNWRAMTADAPDLKKAAYALDSLCEEGLFLAGPLVVGILITFQPAWIGLACAAGLLVAGTVLMVSAPPIRERMWEIPGNRPGTDEDSRPRPMSMTMILCAPGMPMVVIVMFALASGVSIVYISLTGIATGLGNRGAAGWIEAGMALASILGGLVWGKLRLAGAPKALQFGGLLALLAVAVLVAASLADTLWGVAVGLLLAGAAIAPAFITAYITSDEVAPEQHKGEAGSWVNTSNNLGSAFGSATAGVAVDLAGGRAGLLLSAAVLAAGIVPVLASGRRLATASTVS
jgi:hypothetical protein